MKNIKLELFNFRKSLSLDQEDVSYIIESLLNSYNNLSEKQIVKALTERLKTY